MNLYISREEFLRIKSNLRKYIVNKFSNGVKVIYFPNNLSKNERHLVYKSSMNYNFVKNYNDSVSIAMFNLENNEDIYKKQNEENEEEEDEDEEEEDNEEYEEEEEEDEKEEDNEEEDDNYNKLNNVSEIYIELMHINRNMYEFKSNFNNSIRLLQKDNSELKFINLALLSVCIFSYVSTNDFSKNICNMFMEKIQEF
jgi:hypothetical protein